MAVHDTTVQCVVQHALVDFIYTTTDGLDQTTTSNDSIELQGDVGCYEFVEHQLTAEILLFSDITEGSQLLGRMGDIP